MTPRKGAAVASMPSTHAEDKTAAADPYQAADVRPRSGELVQRFLRPITEIVVDEDDLPFDPGERRLQAREEFRDVVALVQGRDD